MPKRNRAGSSEKRETKSEERFFMPDKEKKPEFKVTDRRLFSSEGELRRDVMEDEERRAEHERDVRETQQRANQQRADEQRSAQDASTKAAVAPPPEAPSADDQKASVDAYQQSTREIDEQINQEMRKQGQARRAKDFEMNFEKFIASIYMSALLQLGLAAPPGEKPGVDLIGARQTIDTLSILQEKTKGNLTPAEEAMLQNLLYELRMAYLEVTNLLTRPPQGGNGGVKP
jgi:Domain of unknown function (DUF1844)